MTDLRQDSMTGEQWVFEERTADPASTEEGERWLRTDLNTGDKIATLRVDVGSTIRNVPIFSTGTAVDTVSEAMRLQVNGVTGYVPIVPVSDAAFPELRMQHNSQVHGFHDRVEPGSAIPDSVATQNEWLTDAGSGSTLSDTVGSLDGTINGATWQTGAGTNNTYLKYDGTDDNVNFGTASALDDFNSLNPAAVGFWCRPDTLSGRLPVIVGNQFFFDTPFFVLGFRDSDAELVYGNNAYVNDERVFISGGSPTIGSWHSIAATADNSTARLFLDGTEIASANIPTVSSTISEDFQLGQSPRVSSEAFEGGIDRGWWSDNHVTAAEIQDWHDATAGDYS